MDKTLHELNFANTTIVTDLYGHPLHSDHQIGQLIRNDHCAPRIFTESGNVCIKKS